MAFKESVLAGRITWLSMEEAADYVSYVTGEPRSIALRALEEAVDFVQIPFGAGGSVQVEDGTSGGFEEACIFGFRTRDAWAGYLDKTDDAREGWTFNGERYLTAEDIDRWLREPHHEWPPDPRLPPVRLASVNRGDTQVRGTMAKLLYAMAVDAYGWDPSAQKHPAPAAIADAAARAGLAITPETVRNRLREGRAYAEPSAKHESSA